METTNHDGKLIVLEGTEGSGRGTQYGVLVERLRSAGYPVVAIEYPRYSHESSYFVRELERGSYGSSDSVSPYTASLLYALDRFDTIADIRRALQAGYIVICNHYTGSSMAQEGAKFGSEAERRGFFIWLDGLEYQLLGIPRPDTTLILHMPNDLAKERLAEKTGSTTKVKQPNAEDSARITETYELLCELFPKDFTVIHTSENGQALSVATVGSRIWSKLESILPAPKKLPPFKLTAHSDDTIARVNATVNTSAIKIISYAAAQDIAQFVPDVTFQVQPLANSQKQGYVVPQLPSRLRTEFETSMQKLLKLQSAINSSLSQLEKRKPDQDQKAHAKKAEDLNALLPAAAYTQISLHAPQASVLDSLNKQVEDSKHSKPLQTQIENVNAAIGRLVRDKLPKTPSANPPQTAVLLEFSPRNETGVLPEILYGHSSLRSGQLIDLIERWQYKDKQRILKTFYSQCKKAAAAHPALRAITYKWELQAPFLHIQALQGNGLVSGVSWQEARPEFGYHVPEWITDMNQESNFRECFTISRSLYKKLSQAGEVVAARHALLLGHTFRATAYMDGIQALGLLRKQDDIDTALVKEMLNQISARHPLFADALTKA